MKKKIKILLGIFAVSMLGVFATGCKLVDKIENEIDQSRCNHVFDSGVVQKEATCTETGESLFTCVVCDETELREVEKKPHVEKVLEKISPTCYDSGLSSGSICEVCDTVVVEQVVLPALGHKAGIRKGSPATCTTSGSTDEEYCVRCDEVLTAASVIPATGHNQTTILGYEASCLTYGLTDGTVCSNCNEIYVEPVEIAPLGHDYVNEVCTRCSSTDNFLKTLCPNGYNFEEVQIGESVLGNIYCLGRVEEEYNLTVTGSSFSGTHYTFSAEGFSCNKFVNTSNEQCNATIFEIDGLVYVQFPKEQFIATTDDARYLETSLIFLQNQGNINFSKYNFNVMRVVPLDSYSTMFDVDNTSCTVKNNCFIFDGENDSRVVSCNQYENFCLTFDFTDVSKMYDNVPFIIGFGLQEKNADIRSHSYIEFYKDKAYLYSCAANGTKYAESTFVKTSSQWRIRVMGGSIILFDDTYSIYLNTLGYDETAGVAKDGYIAFEAPVGCAISIDDVLIGRSL